MVTAVGIIFYKYNDHMTNTYYEKDIDTLIKRFLSDINRQHRPEVIWAHLFDNDGNILHTTKRIAVIEKGK